MYLITHFLPTQFFAKLLLLLLVAVLSSCSSTTVHLNARYLSEIEKETLVGAIQEAGLHVETNTHEFPSSIAQSTVLYSPLVKDKFAVDTLIQLLHELNWNVPGIQPFVASNHWFKKNSLGLYLLPEGLNSEKIRATADLSQHYNSSGCENLKSLTLNQNGEYLFSFTDADDRQQKFLTGRWRITQFPYIELVTEDRMWWFYFEVKHSREVDQVSEYDLTRLVPANNYFGNSSCHLEYGSRV